MDLSKLSKKLSVTGASAGGALYMAWDVLQHVLSGTMDLKMGLATVVLLAFFGVVQTAVYTLSQGRVDFGKELAKVDSAKIDRAMEVFTNAAEIFSKKNSTSTTPVPPAV